MSFIRDRIAVLLLLLVRCFSYVHINFVLMHIYCNELWDCKP